MVIIFLESAAEYISSPVASHTCTFYRKSSIVSRKFALVILAIFDLRLAFADKSSEP